ncbi:putative MFS family arabinose efflux permease [Actinoalloteichus hoggarensis]|uniref:Major Facilitator Superfamily protein n=1 Tax=Actinoalloteichus hoggarensis TaxID=1470176 RepID=A0A221W3P8_9PSEU|nr:MFS transporter [Actinoalloteichus hoggarensis]ASO20316.1 Major Facilitator Superfamily protein [Actinoalloteichus hoggarensis]MBB5923354.1 putative MFS family arabinose efflux permease [Actinoalloteichus hoggarensis]
MLTAGTSATPARQADTGRAVEDAAKPPEGTAPVGSAFEKAAPEETAAARTNLDGVTSDRTVPETTSPAETLPAGQTKSESSPVPGDLRMAGLLWPVLVASAVSLLPFTVFSTYLVAIAAHSDSSVAAMGGLRGLGGLASLVVGALLAPLIDRVPRELAAAGALALLGLSAALGAVGHFLALSAFCFLIGAATSVLSPALATAAADRFTSDAASGRAATLVTATQSLAAMLAAPLIVAPGLIWGWQGNLLAVAVVSMLLAGLFLVRSRRSRPPAEVGPRLGYLASFRALAALPGAVPLLLIAALRTAAFMGYLAYLAPFYSERFALEPGPFAFVWTLSGAAFFVGNLFTGRLANRIGSRLPAERLLAGGLLAAFLAISGFYLTWSLPVALLLTGLLGAAHAVVAACVVSLLVRRCPTLRGTALTINAAGMSMGVFVGAALGGAGLGLAGYPGVGVVLGGLTLAAFMISLWVRTPDPASAPG